VEAGYVAFTHLNYVNAKARNTKITLLAAGLRPALFGSIPVTKPREKSVMRLSMVGSLPQLDVYC